MIFCSMRIYPKGLRIIPMRSYLVLPPSWLQSHRPGRCRMYFPGWIYRKSIILGESRSPRGRAGNPRDADMLDAVNDWLTAAGKKMFRLVKATMTLDMWIQIRGFSDTEFKSYVQRVYLLPSEMIEYLPGLKEIFRERYGKEKWHRATRQDLEFEADVSVVPGSYRPRNLDIERKQWMEFLSIIGQFPQLALSRELLRETAAKFQYISERMLDELTALAQKMIQVNANLA